MANFYPINDPKLVKVKPFFTHISVFNQQQQSQTELRRRKAQPTDQNARNPSSRRGQKYEWAHTKTSKDNSLELSMNTEEQVVGDQQRSRKLSLLSKLVLMQLQSNKHFPEQQRGLLNQLQVKNGKQAFVELQMKTKLNELNRTADMGTQPQRNKPNQMGK